MYVPRFCPAAPVSLASIWEPPPRPGASIVFPETLASENDFHAFARSVDAPLLANLTEFGLTPSFTTGELAGVGVAIALYPLSAFRAMNAAALNVFRTVRAEGTQASVIPVMQTRDEYYDFLNYREYEQKIDALFATDSPDLKDSTEGNAQ